MAVLLGCLLSADHVICFSGQMELNNPWVIDKNGLLQHYQNDPSRARYYDLKPFIENADTKIYYIVPMNCAQDLHHYNHVSESINIRCFCFNSKHHGIVINKCNLPRLLASSVEELEELYGKYEGRSISVFLFSIKMVGLKNTLVGVYNELLKQIKHKLRR